MKKFSGRAVDPVYDTVLVPFDGSQLVPVPRAES
jgi:hypothetical protein